MPRVLAAFAAIRPGPSLARPGGVRPFGPEGCLAAAAHAAVRPARRAGIAGPVRGLARSRRRPQVQRHPSSRRLRNDPRARRLPDLLDRATLDDLGDQAAAAVVREMERAWKTKPTGPSSAANWKGRARPKSPFNSAARPARCGAFGSASGSARPVLETPDWNRELFDGYRRWSSVRLDRAPVLRIRGTRGAGSRPNGGPTSRWDGSMTTYRRRAIRRGRVCCGS